VVAERGLVAEGVDHFAGAHGTIKAVSQGTLDGGTGSYGLVEDGVYVGDLEDDEDRGAAYGSLG
jgi:hypothetical protein